MFECSKERGTLRPAVRNIIDTVERAICMTRMRRESQPHTIKHQYRGLAVGWFDSNGLERVSPSPDSGLIVTTTTGNQEPLSLNRNFCVGSFNRFTVWCEL
jgi:hypothetical protein